MASITVCDICGGLISRIGTMESSYIGIGSNVINGCFECQTAVGEFVTDRQAALRPDTTTHEFKPNIDFVEARRMRDAKVLEESQPVGFNDGDK